MTGFPVRLAIIGCGRIAGHHCRSARSAEGVQLIAVCDLKRDLADAYGREFDVPAYVDYHEMLTRHPEVNTVAVITPSGMHLEHARDVMSRYGTHLIVEKPLALRPSHVQALLGEADESGVSVFPVFQNRHNLAVRRVMQGIENGELGEVRVASVRVRWCRPQRYYDLAPWRGTWAMDGGCLTNQGVHHVDLLRTLGGEVDRVSSSITTLGADIEVEDTAAAALRFRSGAVGTVEITTAARPVDYEASLSLVCESGLAQIGGIAVNELQVFTPDPAACATHSEDFSGSVYGFGHGRLYEEVVASLRDGVPYSVSGGDALGTIQLLNAFYVAAEKGSWVSVQDAGDAQQLGRPSEELAALYRTPPPQ